MGKNLLNSEYNLVDGRKVGDYKEFYPNGILKRETVYVNDGTTSKNIKYFPNGKIKLEVNFVDGHMEGPYKEYHSNEKLFKECFYNEKGKLEGNYKEYDVEGNLLKEVTYKNGVEI